MLLCPDHLYLTVYYARTERFIYYRKSVLHLLKRMFHAHLSRCSTDLRLYTVNPVPRHWQLICIANRAVTIWTIRTNDCNKIHAIVLILDVNSGHVAHA